jgi:hypothetical protein
MTRHGRGDDQVIARAKIGWLGHLIVYLKANGTHYRNSRWAA